MIKEVIRKILYCIFPRRCNLCGEIVALDESRCEDCLVSHRIQGEICQLCGREKDKCCCRSGKPEYKGIAAPYYFEENIVSAVHRFKFRGYKELANGMGDEIAECIRYRYSDISFDCVTYVPLTKKRMKQRGYNQSQLLANVVADKLELCCEELLIKIVDNKSQRSKNAKQRKMNVLGVYDINENTDVANKTILLIDDVKTTGSTLSECAKILKGYGAKEVYAAVFTIV